MATFAVPPVGRMDGHSAGCVLDWHATRQKIEKQEVCRNGGSVMYLHYSRRVHGAYIGSDILTQVPGFTENLSELSELVNWSHIGLYYY